MPPPRITSFAFPLRGRRPRGPLLLALGWGMAWGVALGFWLLAPLIVEKHRLALSRAPEWLELVVALAAIFAALGALVSLPAAAIAWALARRRAACAPSTLTLGVVALVPLIPSYLAAGACVYFARFGNLQAPSRYLAALGASLPALVAALGLLVLLRRRPARIALALLVASLAGALALPLRFAGPPAAAVAARRLEPIAGGRASRPHRSPLLIVAIDGGNWSTLEPLLAAGRVPTFDALVRRGVSGDVAALWPPYWSTSAWAAIATGSPREQTGVWEDLAVEAPGLPPFQAPLDLDVRLLPVTAIEYVLTHGGLLRVEPPPRSALRRPPFWELLDRSGIKTAVVRFNFTHPAAGQAAIVISNRIVADLWDKVGVRAPPPEELVAPAARSAELTAPFGPEFRPDPTELERVLPARRMHPRDVEVDPIEVVERVLPFDQRTIESVVRLLGSDPDLEVVLLHLGGFDNVCHSFWPYRFPEAYRHPPSPEESDALGPVVDRYVEFLDRGLARMIAAFPIPPNVLVISDHGETALEQGAPWRGWHASPGILIAAGPDIPPRPGRRAISYYDVAPSVLALQGLLPPQEMQGHPLFSEVPADSQAERLPEQPAADVPRPTPDF